VNSDGKCPRFLVTCVRSDLYLPHPLSSLVGETLDESIYLIVVVAAGKFQELSDKRIAPFGSLWNKQGSVRFLRRIKPACPVLAGGRSLFLPVIEIGVKS
jgi:hypothetical protein